MYYGLGLGLGILMVYFFFGDRDIQCSYFPNDRVLADLRKKELSLSADLLQAPSSSSTDTSGLSMALEFGKVNFGESEIEDLNCNIYRIELKAKQKYFRIENCDSIATVLSVNSL